MYANLSKLTIWAENKSLIVQQVKIVKAKPKESFRNEEATHSVCALHKRLA